MNTKPYRNPELYRTKGADRINVNNLLAAVCVTVLTILVTVPGNQASYWSILQLAIAIPCLITSSLCYAKCAYRSESETDTWDRAGWFTHSVGYACVINATAILLDSQKSIAWIFLGTNLFLFVGYAAVDMRIARSRFWEKCFKTAFNLALMFAGGALPLYCGVR